MIPSSAPQSPAAKVQRRNKPCPARVIRDFKPQHTFVVLHPRERRQPLRRKGCCTVAVWEAENRAERER